MIAKIKNDATYALEQIRGVINRLHTEGPIYASDLELLALAKHFHPKLFSSYEKELLYIMGLFYKVSEPVSMLEEVYAIYADTIKEITGKSLTLVQADAYKQIEEKQFFSFSAPTSAGKSYLFRELIAHATGDIVIVVPSRALIAEYLNSVKRFVTNDVLVLQFIENVNILNTKRRVFVITPERGNELFAYKDAFDVQLFLFDEAQLTDEKYRGIGFDAFVRRVSREFPCSTKVFAHPFVTNPEAQIQKHGFDQSISASSAYRQNSVGKIFVSVNNGEMSYFSPYNTNAKPIPVEKDIIREILQANGTILIYASKAKIYSKQYIKDYWHYLKYCPKLTDPDALHYVDAVRSYIGASKRGNKKQSIVVRLMERGIVIHHGSMPLHMRLIIEEFVRHNHAKLCFATSTLKQGINMPFDAVFIDNYHGMDVLTLKNLIGRSGRSSAQTDVFEYGYTIIDAKHIRAFRKTMQEAYMLDSTSRLDDDYATAEEDDLDLIEAIKQNTFDDESRLTQTQLERLSQDTVQKNVEYVLDNVFIDGRILTGNEYYETLTLQQRTKLKEALKQIYTSHLRRNELSSAEQAVLSTSIPILLWRIQGKTFKEVLALRYAYLTRLSEQRAIRAQEKKGELTTSEANQQIAQLTVKFSQAPTTLPNKSAKRRTDFGKDVSVVDLDYDTLVFDTYDYIDKVIGISLSDPLCAAFSLYYAKTGDNRADMFCKYIRYGTINPTEIWLLKYGFSFEDIAWVKQYVTQIDEQAICFSEAVSELTKDQMNVISRYL